MPGLGSLGRVASAFASPAMTVAGWGLTGALTVGAYRERVNRGEGAASAFVKEAGNFAIGSMMSGPAAFAFYFGVPLVRAGVPALIGAVDRRTHFIRQMRTPFSHRFEATEVVARAQMNGMQAINGSWAHRHMGSEAAAMARRYMR